MNEVCPLRCYTILFKHYSELLIQEILIFNSNGQNSIKWRRKVTELVSRGRYKEDFFFFLHLQKTKRKLPIYIKN